MAPLNTSKTKKMKLFTFLLTLLSFTCLAQDKIAFEFASYQHRDIAKSDMPNLDIELYWKIDVNGKLEVISEDGKCAEIMLDITLLDKLNLATKNGLKTFRNDTKPPAHLFYAGYYSFLKKGEEAVCFNPHNVREDLKQALEAIEKTIEEKKNQTTSNCDLPEKLPELIEATHAVSNLNLNAPPPPEEH